MASIDQLPTGSHAETPISPRADLIGALAWMALGVAILIGSVRMDRLENQDVNPYTVPGLLPGLLGIAMMPLGALLGLRSWRRGAFAARRDAPRAGGAPMGRLALVLGLCLTCGLLLIGHGLPFWLGAALFVTGAILCLQQAQRRAAGQRLTWRALLAATAIGLGAGVVITLVFQEVFLVRLP
ncbi:MAG: tripartite tricarboxylate transporter TctB family protein [Pseudomonadota bacterium]